MDYQLSIFSVYSCHFWACEILLLSWKKIILNIEIVKVYTNIHKEFPRCKPTWKCPLHKVYNYLVIVIHKPAVSQQELCSVYKPDNFLIMRVNKHIHKLVTTCSVAVKSIPLSGLKSLTVTLSIFTVSKSSSVSLLIENLFSSLIDDTGEIKRSLVRARTLICPIRRVWGVEKSPPHSMIISSWERNKLSSTSEHVIKLINNNTCWLEWDCELSVKTCSSYQNWDPLSESFCHPSVQTECQSTSVLT